jgi:membrane protease YdiL (CAAX protease family)
MTNPSTHPPNAKPSVWPIALAWCAALAGTFAVDFVLLYALAAAHFGGASTPEAVVLSPLGIGAVAAANAGVMLLVAALCARWMGEHVLARINAAATAMTIAGAAVGLLGVSVVCGAVLDLLGGPGSTMSELAQAMRGAPFVALVADVVGVGLLAPLGEETLFRGLIQGRAVARFGPSAGIAISSLAFGAIHLDVVQGACAAVSGAFLGWVALRARSLRPCIAAHAINNVLFVFWSAGGGGASSGRTSLFLVAGGVLACAIGVFVTRRATAPRV